jgi:hypothetical protein
MKNIYDRMDVISIITIEKQIVVSVFEIWGNALLT